MATTPQKFQSNDVREDKVDAAFAEALVPLEASKDEFYEGAYDCYVLGDVLYITSRDPLAGAIPQEFYRTALPALHSLLAWPGTFEFYLAVFRKIFGDDVEVEFTIPAPGKLLINIESQTIVFDDMLAREIVGEEYVYHEVMDHEGNNLAFQTSLGIKTQAEVDSLMRELQVAGIWVETTLVIS